MIKRIVNTKETELDLTRIYHHKELDFKPRGLWYALDQEWVDWCKDNMDNWIQPNMIKLEIDETSMLIIETNKQLVNFSQVFKCESEGSFGISGIDWAKVSEVYSGIEIRNYHKLRWNNMLDYMNDIWFCGWDVNSGCIWNLSIIKSFTCSKLKLTYENKE